MDRFGRELNALLEQTYLSIGRLEDAMVRDLSHGSITIAELHTLERVAAAGDEGITVTEIAQGLNVSPPSVTNMVKKLESKGLVSKRRSEEDLRRVVIRMTEAGRRADIAHRYFHRKMILSISASIPEDERQTLITALQRINEFFDERLEAMETSQSREE